MQGKKGKRIAAGVLAGALAVGGLGFNALTASALPGSTFEGADGNLVHVGANTDWDNVANLEVGVDLATGSSDNSFANGSKENHINVNVGDGSIPNSKADLGRFGVASETIEGGTHDGETFMYLAWTRNNTSGTVNFDFEINKEEQPDMTTLGPKTLVRTVGDVLVSYDFNGGAQRPQLGMYTWNGSIWANFVDLDAAGFAEGEVNRGGAVNINPLGSNVNIPAFTFGEAAINMTLAGVIPNTNDPNADCEGFGSAYVKSRSSDPITATMKDFIAPIPVHLNNCGTIVIEKVTDPDPDTTDTSFDFNLSGNGRDEDFVLKNGESETFSDVKAGSGYVAVEDPIPAGWDLTSATCDDGSPVDNIDVAIGETVTCTFTNEGRGSLTVVKDAERPNVDFSFTADAPLDPATFELADGESQEYLNLPAGTYGVAEDGEDGWNLDSATCDDGSDPAAVEISPGEDVTCTFVNVIERGAVLIHKTAKHADSESGTINHAGVTFTVENASSATDVDVVTDANGFACVDNLPVSELDGAYTVTETVPVGYVSEDSVQNFVVEEGTCESILPTSAVEFVNIPLTNVRIEVDSQIDGGTSSIINCGGDDVVTDADGDGFIQTDDLEPTAPDTTITCTVIIDP